MSLLKDLGVMECIRTVLARFPNYAELHASGKAILLLQDPAPLLVQVIMIELLTVFRLKGFEKCGRGKTAREGISRKTLFLDTRNITVAFMHTRKMKLGDDSVWGFAGEDPGGLVIGLECGET